MSLMLEDTLKLRLGVAPTDELQRRTSQLVYRTVPEASTS